MTAISPNYAGYRDVRDEIRDADLVLFRRRGLTGAAIGAVGRSIYSHVGMAAWWSGSLMLLEMREWYGGRAVRLSSQVAECPGSIDIYQANVWDYHREAIVDVMRRHAGTRYAWSTIRWIAWRNAPIVRWLVGPPMDDNDDDSPAVCSTLVSRAYRHAGYDPVRNRSDRATTPGDLGGSALFDYCWTLTE